MALSLTARASGANTTRANAATVNRRSAILTTTTVLTATLKAKPARGRAKLPPPGKTDVKSVLIVGATGGVGREVVRCVLDSKEKGQMKLVRAAARNFDDDYKAMQGNVQLVPLDVVTSTDEEIAKAVDGVDAVVCAVGVHVTTSTKMSRTRMDTAHLVDNLGVSRLVDAAIVNGNVKHFVLVSALLTNAPALGRENNRSYVTLELLGNVLSEKHEAEEHLRNACEGSQTTMQYTIIRPGALAGGVSDALFRDDAAPLGELVGPADTFFEISASASVRRSRVAELCVASLADVRARNRTVEFTGSRMADATITDWFV